MSFSGSSALAVAVVNERMLVGEGCLRNDRAGHKKGLGTAGDLPVANASLRRAFEACLTWMACIV